MATDYAVGMQMRLVLVLMSCWFSPVHIKCSYAYVALLFTSAQGSYSCACASISSENHAAFKVCWLFLCRKLSCGQVLSSATISKHVTKRKLYLQMFLLLLKYDFPVKLIVKFVENLEKR